MQTGQSAVHTVIKAERREETGNQEVTATQQARDEELNRNEMSGELVRNTWKHMGNGMEGPVRVLKMMSMEVDGVCRGLEELCSIKRNKSQKEDFAVGRKGGLVWAVPENLSSRYT